MRRFLAAQLIVLACLFHATIGYAQLAGGLQFPGPGTPHTASTFQGIGDVVTSASALAWGSCARVYTAAQASTATSLCDLVDSAAPTVPICTLRGSSTGFVDLTGTYCTGSVTPAAKCAAATGAVCNVSKVYDQTGSARDWTNTTAATQPVLVFAAVNSLPAMGCNGTTTIIATPNITQAQPWSAHAVYNRTSGTAVGTALGAGSGGTLIIGADVGANKGRVSAGGPVGYTATDAAWHGVSLLANGVSSADNVDGVDSSPISAGTVAFSANAMRFCTDNANFLNGRVAEGGLWGSALNSTQRGAIYTNQHGANGYNGAF